MKKPQIPLHESERLAALNRYKILDTLPEQEYDDLTQLAADICETPIALISLVDRDRQWFKSRVGLEATETSRDISFCGHAVAEGAILNIPDTIKDARFADNPLVIQDPKIRFYVGVPLITPNLYTLGTLCVIDRQPRALTPKQIQQLQALGRLVMSQLELRLSVEFSERQAAEVALRKSEERLRLALRAANQGLYDLNLQTGEAIVSPEYATMLGYDPDTFQETNSRWLDRMHPDDREIVANTYKDYVAGNLSEYKVEFRQRTQSGEWKWLLSLGKILEWDELGNPIRMLGIHTDISDRKQAEDQAKNRLDILEAARDIIASMDNNGFITYLNQAGRSLLGISSDEDISHTKISDYHSPQISDLILREAIPQCVQQGYWSGETIFRRHDGIEFPVLQVIVCHRGQDRQVNQFSTIARDISDRKQAEAALQQLNQELEAKVIERTQELWKVNIMQQAILDSADYSFISTDINGIIQTFNASAERMLDYSAAEVIGKVTPAIIHDRQEVIDRATSLSVELDRDIPIGFEVFVAKARLGLISEEEWTYIRKDGSRFPVLLSVTALKDANHQITGFLGIAKDISEQQAALCERKQAEDRLRESQEELDRFFSVALDLLCIADLEGTFSRLNRSWETTLGYPLAELEGQKFLDFVHPDDVAATIGAMTSLNEQKTVIAFVNRYRCKDGSYRYIEWYCRPYENSIYAAARDITERRQAEAEIIEKQRFVQKIADASPNILYLYDLHEHRNLYCNREIADVLGYTSAEVQAMGANLFTNLMHPDDLAKMPNYYQQIELAQDGDIFEIEYRMRHVDGEYRWLLSRDSIFTRDEQGHPKQTIGTAQDISDRKQAEESLRNLSDRLTLAVKSAEIGIWDWDIPQNILTWDDRMYELYDLKPEQFANAYEAWVSTIYPEDRPNTENAIQQALRGEKEYDPEFRVFLPDGTKRFIKAYSLVQRNEQGDPLRMVGVNLDISDRKQAEITIQQTTAQLEASNRELEAFAYSVSHDLRAPLRAIDGFSNALIEDYGDKFDAEGRDYFDRIRRNVHRMGMLIDDLLRLSRVSRSAMQYTDVNLSTLVQEQILELQEVEPERQVEAIVAPDIIVSADITLMKVVISNLIQNAWKFTSHHPTARIEFGVVQQEGQPIYFVRDDGAGFDMNYTKMLFRVFQRLHNTNEFPGTGIGLATVQRAIHRHSGRVWAEGFVEKGATIYFTVANS